VITVVIVVVFLGVTIFGSGEDAETKAVIRIAHRAAPPHDAPKAPEGASLIATNGAVISEPGLIEMTSDGPLPKISDSGRKPMTAYARDYDRNDPRPKVALIMTGLGLSATVTQAAVDQLPGGITFSFTPYGSTLQGAVSTSRANGHEVLLEVPLEPYDYPDNDPGQNTLLTGKPAADNPARLNWIMSRATGYAGVLNVQGSKFLASVDDVEVLLRSTKKRGIYFVDNGQSDQSLSRMAAEAVGAPFAKADQQVDREPTAAAIERELALLESAAVQKGGAIGIASAYPVSVDRIRAWAAGLEQRGVALVPVSALVVTREPPPSPKPAPSPAKPSAAVKPTAHHAPASHARPAKHAPDASHSDPGPHP
jgi:polysaccharide deacetylase 2 family uncharacterized protein YibQ